MTNNEQDVSAPKALSDKLKSRKLEEEEVPEVLEFLKKNGVSILIGVAVAVIAYVGISIYRNMQTSAEQEAAARLIQAQSAAEFQTILDEFGNTRTAPLAHLSLASSQYDNGQYDLARHLFIQFQDTYPDHEFVSIAELSVAQCDEALGEFARAISGYEAFAAAHPDHYMMPVAEFGRARSLEQMGRYDEARKVYEDFIANHPESRWTARAETGIEFVGMAERGGGSQAAAQPQIMLNPAGTFPAANPSLPSVAP